MLDIGTCRIGIDLFSSVSVPVMPEREKLKKQPLRGRNDRFPSVFPYPAYFSGKRNRGVKRISYRIPLFTLPLSI